MECRRIGEHPVAMTYAEFQKVLASGRFAPIYLFYGEEDFLVDECVHAVIGKTLAPDLKGFNLDIVYGSNVDVKDVVAHASSFPMMSEKRVVVVKEFEKLAPTDTAKEILSAYIDQPLESTCLLLISLEPDFRKKPFTDLKKRAEIVECKPLYDNQVPDWVTHRIRELGKRIDPDASRLLQAYVGNSLRALQNEIDKLFIFVGEKKDISLEDVNAIVGATKGFTIFDLQNAIGRKDTKEAMMIVEKMLETGQSPQMIIVMLTRFFTQLWKLTDSKLRRQSEREIISELGVHPYFLKQILEFSRLYSVDHIEQNFHALLEADTVLKSTSRDPHLVLDLLIYSLINRSPVADEILSP